MMKKKYMAFHAVVIAGMLMTGGLGAGVLPAAAEETTQETQTGGIRAKAPQGVRAADKDEQESGSLESADADQADAGKDAGKKRPDASDREREPSQEAAIQAALADAGLTQEELTGLRVKEDTDDGHPIYEVELYVDAEEYSYEIDVQTAQILEAEHEVEEDYDRVPEDPDALTREEATQIVLDKVEGATDMDIRIKYEYDDGKEMYEGDLLYDGIEYEFELSALDGQILEWSEEKAF